MTTTHYVIACSLVLSATLSASAQSPTNTPSQRWTPWLGCWQLAEESIQGDVANTPAARVCVTPSADGGATMTTLVRDKAVRVETIVADGAERPVAEPDCRGSQQAEWSPLGARVYARTEVTCGTQPKRVVSGLSTVVAGPSWVDIQMIESEGRKSMRVRRYRRAAEQKEAVATVARDIATMPLGAKLSIADIKEVSAKLPREVVQAAVLELGGDGYDLNAKRLLELDAAGVPDSVIDLMVAMSFPERFVVERAASSGFAGDGYGGGGFGIPDYGMLGAAGLFGYDMWSYYAHPMFYSSYYSPFGYGHWGYYDPYYGVAVINPGGGTVSPTEPSGSGRVIDGQGYTRIRRNEPAVPTRANNGGNDGVSTSGAGAGSGSTGTSGVSTGGYSGGSSGGGRTAVPRPPGGN
jgi:hypothetical protein